MVKVIRRFFDFCGETNRKKFVASIWLGVLIALFEALKIPAIAVMMRALLPVELGGNGGITTGDILMSLGIMLLSILGSGLAKAKATMLQTEAGYDTCAMKRIEIAEHMRYLPMGYFNENSLGQITSVTTNVMESLENVATRVVMMVAQGLLTTLLIIGMLSLFDWRVALVLLIGFGLFLLMNGNLQTAAGKLAGTKIAADEKLVEKVLEYIQGMAEVKAYHLTGQKSGELNAAIAENVKINTDMEMTLIPRMTAQTFMEDVIAAAKKACCHDFITALPEGYDTVIGEGGVNLSGGERQRISIARAMMKDAPVIFLDEATANVDPENENELTKAIKALTREKTVIMIAHRLKTVEHADQILVVDHGKIVQRGTHEQLMAEEGIYRTFVGERREAASWKVKQSKSARP